MSQPTKVVKAVSKKALVLKVETGANEARLEEIGFSRPFQREAIVRPVIVNTQTGLPTTKEEAGRGNWREVLIKNPIVSYGVITSVDEEFKLAFVSTTRNLYFVAMSGVTVWTFIVDGSANDVREAVRTLFNDSLVRGPRTYNNNNTMVPNFWQRALSLVYPEPTIIEIGLRNKEQQYVPSRVYFHPEQPQLNILAAGGFCYDFQLDEFPRESINFGMGLWTAEQRKRNDRTGVVQIGQLLVKPGNKGKEKRAPKPDIASLGLKPLSAHLVVHEVPEAEKLALEQRAVAKMAKSAIKAAPVTKAKKKA